VDKTRVATRVAAGVLSAAAGGLWLWCAVTVLNSRLATDPATDPHGYGLIFGTFLAIPAGLAWVLALPFAFPQRHRTRAFRFALLSFLVVSALLVLAWIMGT
jgi:uncharacterized membrane-anchored protein